MVINITQLTTIKAEVTFGFAEAGEIDRISKDHAYGIQQTLCLIIERGILELSGEIPEKE